ncbi:TonB-dependent receptor [Pelagicoccus sp. SDUM812003]|uniref:TonB-dependent receptor n=1 Tax=Pelagicoccus sp. SDUM812003 TaxID=3041267 RepID=UPI0028100B7C|nr:TonB-dependent receptor [Pelagicoccus sp. SDUM812003]MDQ8204897.1 TonB-dependent receptor [Pelagicoccus sp. SDUM812003]
MTVSNPTILRLSAFSAGFALSLSPLLADGSLSGRVVDADTGVYLDGVLVTHLATGQTAITRRGGEYVFSSLPEGPQQFQFRYLGFEDGVETISIQNGLNERDLQMSGDFVELEGVTVKGSVIGQARALNFQKSSDALVNAVSADAIGQFPDQNAAEALSRLPGVSVERDQGEGRFVVIRGIDPNLNSVSVDGVKLASPSTGDRATLLDTIPSDNLQQLEVFKTALPSHPGDSVGGYINIKTPSAYDQEGITARMSLQGNYSDLIGDWKGKLSGAYGNTFNEGTIGFLFSASMEERKFGSDNNESDPWVEEDGEDGSSGFVSEAVELREYDLLRTRKGLTSNLEFKPSNDAYYFLRASWNRYKDTETRNAGVIEPDGFTEITNDSFVGLDSELVREFKDRTEKMGIEAYSLGGENQFGETKVDYTLAYSKAEEDTPYDFEAIYEFEDGVDIRFSDTTRNVLGLSQIGGNGIYDPNGYAFDEIVVSNQLVEEEDLSANVNVTHFISDSALREIKWGVLAREKEKTSDLDEFENDENPEIVDTLDAFTLASPRDPFGFGLPLIDHSISTFYQDNLAAFAMELAEDASALEDFTSNEDVLAAYLQAKFQLSDWEFIAGARLEDTDFTTTGFAYNDDTEEIYPTSGGNSYSNFLPGIHARKELDENTVLRLSWNNTIARPSFEQTIPFAEIEGDEVEIGNPMLDPLESMNFDISVERYLPSLGILSAAVFHKEVDNFIYEQTLFQPYADIEDAEVTTFRNGEDGSITGLELAFQRRFSFLPAPFDGLGTYINLTFVDGEATVAPAEEGDPTRELPFIKQSEMVGNIALTYEKERIFLRLAASWRDEYLDEIGAEPIEDRYMQDHMQLDLTTSYQITPQLSVFANWLNITDEPLHAAWGETGRLSQLEEYGWSANTGIRWSY